LQVEWLWPGSNGWFRIAEFSSARLTATLGIASIPVNSCLSFQRWMAPR
jgi:hypothetical protein